MKYRQKPVIVEAVHFLPQGGPTEPRRFFLGIYKEGGKYFLDISKDQRLEVKPGDWIITDVDGTIRPCNPKVFDMLYETV